MLNRRATILIIALLGVTISPVAADDNRPSMRAARQPDIISLDAGPSPSLERRPSAEELKQARAWQRHLDRQAIIRANAWAGYEPLRPTLPANPFTQVHGRVYRPFHIWSVYDYVTLP